MFTLDEFREVVIEGIKKHTNVDHLDIGDDEDMGDHGVDSLTGFNLVLELEAAFGIDLGEFDIDEANTINLLYEKVKRTVEESE